MPQQAPCDADAQVVGVHRQFAHFSPAWPVGPPTCPHDHIILDCHKVGPALRQTVGNMRHMGQRGLQGLGRVVAGQHRAP